MFKRKASSLSLNETEQTRLIPKPRSNKSLTRSWNDIPDWQKYNEYIPSGYRPVQNNWSGCLASVFVYFHNDTVNIHSHLWGAMYFAFALLTFQTRYVEVYETTTWVDTSVIAVSLASAVFCLSASALFHTSSCHSEKVAAQCRFLDFIGIIVLGVGSIIPFVFYGFFCDPTSQACHLLAFAFATTCAMYVMLNPEYARPNCRGVRAGVSLAFGLCALVPITHVATTNGLTKVFSEMGYGWLLATIIFHVGGALIYASRFPERTAPGKFDYLFSSHQIFHVCVVLAMLAHWFCVLAMLEYRHAVMGGVCDAAAYGGQARTSSDN